ncbi:unnamed protein product [Brassicogethes aeneus]|uniref:Dynein heavy chain AAA 5 extension domain-containing protein n=1 Tax=Brassicogethes aeneus TaxID=1431903 RepID=A0A9P0ARB1_BRAAE|nr:unnamed protein product [Brassicogethes aeneus]
MAPTCKILFEPHNIDNASPATVSRNGMVYMSSSGLDWRPVVQAWLKKRNSRECDVFKHLFDESFAELYAWGTQMLVLVINVLQCLVPSQPETSDDILTIKSDVGDNDEDMGEEIENLEEKKIFTSEHLKKLYVFALVWGMGAFLENNDRKKFDTFIKEKLKFLDIPMGDRKNPDVCI